MSDTEIRMMRYTIEQLSAELQATRQYVSDIKSKSEHTRKALDIALDAIDKAEAALIGCQEADDKYISDVTAEYGLELMSKAYKQITALTKGGSNE